MEVELLLESESSESESSEINCVRINPNDYHVKKGHVGIGLGSLESIVEIGRRLGTEVQGAENKEKTEKRGEKENSLKKKEDESVESEEDIVDVESVSPTTKEVLVKTFNKK